MATKAEFVQSVYQAALEAGLSDPAARVMAAQAAIESGYGEKAPGNNYFGIKAGKSWNGATQQLTTHEVVDGKRVKTKANFRSYDSPEDGIADRIAFMADKFPEFNDAPDMGTALDALQKGKYGKYFTDDRDAYEGAVNYVNTHFLDGKPVPPGSIPEGVASETDNGVAQLQQQLEQRGFSPGAIDGVAGPKTKAAIKAFQTANGLAADGVVGPKTQAALDAQQRPQTQPQPRLGTRQPANILPPGPLIQPQDIRDAFFDPLPAPSPLEAPGVWQGPVLGGGTQGNVLGGAPKPMPGRPASLNGTVPLPREAPAPATTAPEAPQPTGGGFNLGSMIGDLGNTLGQTANNVGKTLGNAATNVVEGTKAGLEKTAESVKDTLTNELIGTVKGRTLLMNTALGIQPRRDPAAERRMSAPEGFAYGATGKKLYRIGQTYQSSRGPVTFNGSGFVPAGKQTGVRTEVSISPTDSTKSTYVQPPAPKYGGPTVLDEVGARRYHG
jgi:peptidoglycan hydrolase-like protein with peptidoglycan-binding domain